MRQQNDLQWLFQLRKLRLKEITIAIHKVTGLEFPKAKIRVDTTLVILAVILGYILLGSWQWQIVGVGTLFAMVYVGMVVRIMFTVWLNM